MRRVLWLTPVVLALSGCYVPPPQPAPYGYAQPGYAPPGYPPAYAAPAQYDPYAAYPGYEYNDGAPVYVDGGISFPLIFFGGAWGYYDSRHEFHHAPEGVGRDLSNRRAAGVQFHAPANQPGGYHPAAGYRAPEAGRPPQGYAAPANAARPNVAPANAAPGGYHPPEGYRPPAAGYAAQPGYRPQEQPRPAPAQNYAAPRPLQAAPQQQHQQQQQQQQQQHQERRDCPAGQHC